VARKLAAVFRYRFEVIDLFLYPVRISSRELFVSPRLNFRPAYLKQCIVKTTVLERSFEA
jgi:hypothetical protein